MPSATAAAADMAESSDGRSAPAAIRSVGRLLGALAGAVLATAAVFGLLGVNPLDAFSSIIRGSLGDSQSIGATLRAATPIALTGLAAAIPFSARLWNVGGEGQFYAGAIAALTAGLLLDSLPAGLLTVVAVLFGVLAGGAWAGIAGALRAYRGANEVIVTLMLNVIALLAATWLITGLFAQDVVPQTRRIPEGVDLPNVWQAGDVGVAQILVILGAILAYFILRRSRFGVGVQATGAGADAARRAGFNIRTISLAAFVLGGAFAGLAGAIIVVDVQKSLVANLSEAFGFIGIAVALVARLNPLLILPSALSFGIVIQGSQSLTADVGLSAAAAPAIIAIIVLFLLAFGAIRLRHPGVG